MMESGRENSTSSAMNADNISLKSGLSTLGFALEGPGIHGELPHHGEAFGRRPGGEVIGREVIVQRLQAYAEPASVGHRRCTRPA